VKAVVVGAGLAGLVAARALHRRDWEVIVLEASDSIGGRVRTDVLDGFRLDRGVQMLYTASPAVKRQLDVKALRLRAFDAGAIVVEGNRWNELGNPLQDLKSLVPTAFSTALRPADKLLLLRLLRRLKRQPVEQIREQEVGSAEFLRAYGFSEQAIDLLLAPLLGSLLLDPSLSISSDRTLFDLKMLASGRAAVPRDGMQAIPDQLAADLPAGAIRLNTPALSLEFAGSPSPAWSGDDGVRAPGNRVAAVKISSETIEANAVILAAHSPEAERLSKLPLPKDAYSVTCLYFHLPHPLYGHKKLVLNAYPDRFVASAVQISNVASSYAPAPEHLLAATILGAPDLSLEQMAERALDDMQRWFPWRRIRGLKPLAAYQVPFARLHQPPGFQASRPANRTAAAGLYLAGEYTTCSSIDGALASGERAAQALLDDVAGD
jgi:phytoene dehydrogenase-like protein